MRPGIAFLTFLRADPQVKQVPVSKPVPKPNAHYAHDPAARRVHEPVAETYGLDAAAGCMYQAEEDADEDVTSTVAQGIASLPANDRFKFAVRLIHIPHFISMSCLWCVMFKPGYPAVPDTPYLSNFGIARAARTSGGVIR